MSNWEILVAFLAMLGVVVVWNAELIVKGLRAVWRTWKGKPIAKN
jgi:hypothetical protein